MLIDTHCHIHDRATYDFAIARQQISKKLLARHSEIPHEKPDFTPKNLLHRARANGVEKMITVGTSHRDSLEACKFADRHENVFWSYGIHPDEAPSFLAVGSTMVINTCGLNEATSFLTATGGASRGPAASSRQATDADGRYDASGPVADKPVAIKNPVAAKNLVAIGEIGLDYRNGTDTRKQQITLFERMLSLATNANLPCIFHVREAFDDFFAVLDNFPKIERAVVHSFSDSPENLEKSLSRGFFIGINGLATFADIYPDRLPPLDRTLLETDAPFLAPVPVRGHVNEPAYIRDIAEFLSKRHHLDFDQIADVTTKNAETLFSI